MIDDAEIQKAVTEIQQRSEKQRDLQKLVVSFVDVGILPQIRNTNSQIIYGRRGTGKTHVLKVLEAEQKTNAKIASIYIDARTLGSTSQFSNSNLPLEHRCLNLFKDILAEVHDALLTAVVENPAPRANEALGNLDQLATLIAQPFSVHSVDSVERKINTETENASGVKAELSPKSLALAVSADTKTKNQEQVTYTASVSHEDKLVFPGINRTLTDLCKNADLCIFLLLDEWSSLPLDLQPYLAEFLKRGFLPIPTVIVKIASLEYRSNFLIRSNTGLTGMEVGSDIATGLDLDDYYVFDRNPDQVTDAFKEMLYKHLRSELPENYLENAHNIYDADRLITSLFANSTTSFRELVRAAEGVARDLINIFTRAFFSAQRKGRDKIDKLTITEAAHQWFEQDKARNLDDELSNALQRIVREVIGAKNARSFLVPRDMEQDELVQRLFDARVLHLVKRGYADKDNPGVRYNIYTLDYGTYVDLLGTSRSPIDQSDVLTEEFSVPIDDKRSIRRIVLTHEVLYPNNTGSQELLAFRPNQQ